MKHVAVACLVCLVGCSHQPSRERADILVVAPPPPPAQASTVPAATRPAAIDSFQGEYRFLSNFWPAGVEFEGITYPTAEHAYQAAKTLDVALRKRIAAEPTPAD